MVTCISRQGTMKSCFTFLILCLHLSLMGEEVATLPNAYTNNESACVAMKFFHFYFSLMNITVVALLVECYRSFVLEDYYDSRARIMKYGIYIILIFPVITAIPFATGSYNVNDDDDNRGWCTPSFEHDSSWTLGIYFIWVWLCLLGAIGMLIYSGFRVCRKDKIVGKSFFSSIGLYVAVAILSWIPRSFVRLVQYDHSPSIFLFFAAYLPIDISGICYTLIFLREQSTLEQMTIEQTDEVGNLSFTWEKHEIMELTRSSQITRSSQATRSSATDFKMSMMSTTSNPFFVRPDVRRPSDNNSFSNNYSNTNNSSKFGQLKGKNMNASSISSFNNNGSTNKSGPRDSVREDDMSFSSSMAAPEDYNL